MTEHVTDLLGEQWLAETITLAPDFEGEVVATLVSRRTEVATGGMTGGPTERATLHVHGFSDYFFHAEYGAWWLGQGHDMYGLDLRKYGRSLRPHQTATYVADIEEYFEELDAAWERITVRDGHRRVVLSAHSTGGLVVSLWADSRKPTELAGLVLNSPWLDLQGKAWLRSLPATAVVDRIGRRQPLRELPREVRGLYARSLHRDHEGEWDFDLTWKPVDSFPVRFGWLRAVRQGQTRLHQGLDVPAPVLVLSSDRSSAPTEMCDDVFCTDIVLDVRQIRRWSTSIGPHVTSVMVPGAVHDVVLSRPDARTTAYEELQRWLSAYL